MNVYGKSKNLVSSKKRDGSNSRTASRNQGNEIGYQRHNVVGTNNSKTLNESNQLLKFKAG